MSKSAATLVPIEFTKALIPKDGFHFWHLAVLPLLFIVIWVLRLGSRPAHCPPGPPTFPILGNLLQVINNCPTACAAQETATDACFRFLDAYS